eukprot:63960_1
MFSIGSRRRTNNSVLVAQYFNRTFRHEIMSAQSSSSNQISSGRRGQKRVVELSSRQCSARENNIKKARSASGANRNGQEQFPRSSKSTTRKRALFAALLIFIGIQTCILYSIGFRFNTAIKLENEGPSSIAIGQYSCANCGKYAKTAKCTRVHQLETATELADADLETCNKYSRKERPWMNWLFSDKSVFEIPQPTTASKAAREIPEALRSEYTLGGRINVTKAYYKQIYAGNKKRLIKWSEQDIERIIAEIQAGKHSGMYGTSTVKDMYVTFQKYSSHLGGHGVVIGTKRPWVECAALAANNATRVTTYEYSYINSTHPRIHSVLPSEFARKYANDKDFQPFDWAASFSSIEHSGLGRYGDPLCPWGDAQAMFRVSCMLKPGGLFFFAVPTTTGGVDGLTWNAHRVYGKLRLRFMFENYRVIEATKPVFAPSNKHDFVQHIVVLQNMRGCTNGKFDRF